jgi:3-deoxy-manno-octulosonate cytidylyltransferase (CMP-KDO synthetase)
VKKLIVIPARYGSTRLPGKPLLPIGDKPVLQWVFEKALQSRLKDGVIIATDDERIRVRAEAFGAEVVMTSPECQSGTERVFDAVRDRGAGVVVNLQGDEPFVEPPMIDVLFSALLGSGIDMATLCCPITSDEEFKDPNTVKVVLDGSGFALYFSRSSIPFRRTDRPVTIYKHVGIYGFTGSFLQEYVAMPKGRLEEAESLEQLRVLENGRRIKVLETGYDGFGIDTEADLARACRRLETGRR